jgi:outer membrane protein OmpA-like peptidoglycan-associated protein
MKMKKLFVILFLVNLTWAYPIISFNGEWYGTAGHFGPYSVFHSPQNLAGKYNPSFVLMLPYLHTGLNNNLISLDFYNELAPMDTITDGFKQKVLNKIGESFELSQYSSVMPLGISIGPVGLASRVVEAAKVNLPRDLFRIGLYGVQVNNFYDFSSLEAEAISYIQNTLGFGVKEKIANKKVYFGLSGSYIVGLGYAKITSRTGRIEVSDTSMEVKDTVDFMYSTPDFVYDIKNLTVSDIFKAPGYGFSMALGSSVELTPKFTLGLTLENLVSNIKWNSDSTFTGIATISSKKFNLYDLYNADSLKEIFTDTLERKVGSFNTKLPVILRLSGRYDFYRAPLKFYFDVEQGFKKTALSSTTPRLSLALELNTFLPVMLGATFGGGQRPNFSLGTGFQLPFMFINAGVSNQGGIVSSAEGLSVTVAAGFRSAITQKIEGTIIDSTTGSPIIAKVKIERYDGKVKTLTTKDDGKFKVKIPWGWTKISVYAQNYTSKDTVIFVDKKEKVKTTFYLKPLVGELVVMVTDFVTGLPKAYVPVIVVDTLGHADTLLTDSSGKVSKKYLEGVYSIKIEEANYKPVYETFDLKALETVTKNYTIMPMEGEVIGKVVDAKTLSPLVATVEIYDSTGNLIETINTSENGEFSMKLKEGLYRIKAQAEKYIPYETSFVIEGGKKTTKDIALLKKKMVFTFRNIYFEFNKADIKPESYPVLDSIAMFLKEYPNVKVEIGGHTDSRGSDAYNLKLSQARAEAVRDYLIKVHNISPDRLIAKGYGERRLVVYPEKTEEDYQMNRRVEFTILGTIE